MYWGVVLFETLCWVVFFAMLGILTYLSFKQGRVMPGLWFVLGIFAMSWIEAPFDNAMYAQFHPDFHRLPPIGPIGMTQGLLPVIAPPGYIMYFLLPALVAVAVARLIIKRYNTNRVNTLLASGLVVGILWDVSIEGLQAQYLHLWTFSRVVPGLALSNGVGLLPSYIPLAMAAFIVGAAYVIGNTTPEGDSVIDVWVKSRATSPGATFGLQALAYIVFCNVLYGLTYLPHAITKYAGMLTQTGVLVPYPGKIAMQPESGAPQSDGFLGAIIMWGLLIGCITLTWWWAKKADRLLITPTLTSAAPAGKRAASLAT
jgi:Spirocyclase AveC-like